MRTILGWLRKDVREYLRRKRARQRQLPHFEQQIRFSLKKFIDVTVLIRGDGDLLDSCLHPTPSALEDGSGLA